MKTTSAMHPQRARIECAIEFLRSVQAYWDESEVANYPKELPSFDEYVAGISDSLRSIEWKTVQNDQDVQPSLLPDCHAQAT